VIGQDRLHGVELVLMGGSLSMAARAVMNQFADPLALDEISAARQHRHRKGCPSVFATV